MSSIFRNANKAILFGATTAAFALAFVLLAMSQGAFREAMTCHT